MKENIMIMLEVGIYFNYIFVKIIVKEDRYCNYRYDN